MTIDDRFFRLQGMFYHRVTEPIHLKTMDMIREAYVTCAMEMLSLLPEGARKEEALGMLEMSQMRAIQSVALQGEMIIPERLRDAIE